MDINSYSPISSASNAQPSRQSLGKKLYGEIALAGRLDTSADALFAAAPANSTAAALETSVETHPHLASNSHAAPASEELRGAFQDFVGQTFFAEMIKACRSGQQPSAYFNGGRAEEIFQGQLDQVLSEELSKASADKIADPMFDLFMLKRQS